MNTKQRKAKVLRKDGGYWVVETRNPYDVLLLRPFRVAPSLQKVGAKGVVTYNSTATSGMWRMEVE